MPLGTTLLHHGSIVAEECWTMHRHESMREPWDWTWEHLATLQLEWQPLLQTEVICAALYYWFETNNPEMTYCPAPAQGIAPNRSSRNDATIWPRFLRMMSSSTRMLVGIASTPSQQQCDPLKTWRNLGEYEKRD